MANTMVFHPVGEVFTYRGISLKVVEGRKCAACYFAGRVCPSRLACTTIGRKDETHVYFERYEPKKGGENGRN